MWQAISSHLLMVTARHFNIARIQTFILPSMSVCKPAVGLSTYMPALHLYHGNSQQQCAASKLTHVCRCKGMHSSGKHTRNLTKYGGTLKLQDTVTP